MRAENLEVAFCSSYPPNSKVEMPAGACCCCGGAVVVCSASADLFLPLQQGFSAAGCLQGKEGAGSRAAG